MADKMLKIELKKSLIGRGDKQIATAEALGLKKPGDVTVPVSYTHLRADIDYGFAEAATTDGRIGVKVWVYKGEVLKSAKTAQKKDCLLYTSRCV